MENLEINENELVLEKKAQVLVVEEDNSMKPLIVTEDDKLTKNDIEISVWKDPNSFLSYLKRAMSTVPSYSDQSTNSLKRAIAYYDTLLSEIEETVAKDAEFVDFNESQMRELDKIDNIIVEARNELVDKLDKSGSNIKTQQLAGQMIKQAKGAPLTWTVDPFLKAIVTTCINAKVQGGKNIEEVYQALKKEYSLDKREDLAVLQILKDAGYPIRHSMLGDSSDMIAQYYA